MIYEFDLYLGMELFKNIFGMHKHEKHDQFQNTNIHVGLIYW